MNSLCIIGLGYIGLPTAAMFANNGMQVTGVDINAAIIDHLNHRKVHIEELGLHELVIKALDDGTFKVSDRPTASDAYIIAVPTPFKQHAFGYYNGEKYKLADMRAVISACEAVVPLLKKGDLVILESTSPVRTTEDLVKPILEKSGLQAGEDFFLAYSPERVLPGQIIQELEENSRVIGGITPESAQKGKELYSKFVKGEIIMTDASTAEMVKLMENAYRDVNIAIANEYSRLADRFGVDVWEAIAIANWHPRVEILNPGPGVGGHCISVDPWFLVEGAPDLARLLWTARQVNDAQPAFVVEFVRRVLGGLKGKRICALGLAYKPNVGDIRESPAVEVIRLLQKEGAEVNAYEPNDPETKIPGISTKPSLASSMENTDCLLVLVAHDQFMQIIPIEIIVSSKFRKVISTVNGLNADDWKKAGFEFTQFGNG